jgi:hypothetical protein
MDDSQVKTSNNIEYPVSWSVKYLLDGFDCLLCLRGESGSDVLSRSQAALKWLQDNGAQPTVSKPGNGSNGNQEHPATKVCEYHNAEMKRHEKDGQVWYSHKLADGSYCKGKEATK